MPQIPETSSNAAQNEYWNTTGGETWAQFQETLDRQVEPLGLAAMDALSPGEGGHTIIDIGCECGQTSLALAARVRPTGSVMGVDIPEPMLDVALRRSRSADLQVAFRKLDAQTGDLGHGLFDAAFSRFGVMFFSDPVAAFANIGASLKPRTAWLSSVGDPSMRIRGCRPRCKLHLHSYHPLRRPISRRLDRLRSLTRAACARYWLTQGTAL